MFPCAVQERFTAVPVAVGSSIPPIPPCGDDLYIAGRPCVDFVWSPANDTAARVRGVPAYQGVQEHDVV